MTIQETPMNFGDLPGRRRRLCTPFMEDLTLGCTPSVEIGRNHCNFVVYPSQSIPLAVH